MTVFVTIERCNKVLATEKFKDWPKDGLKGVLLDSFDKLEDGWYVVSAATDNDGGDILSMQGFRRAAGRIYTFDMTYIEDVAYDMHDVTS